MKTEQRQAVSELSILPDHSDDPQKLSDLIGAVYDTVLDPSLWVGVLERVAHFVRGTGAALFSKNVANQEGSAHYELELTRITSSSISLNMSRLIRPRWTFFRGDRSTRRDCGPDVLGRVPGNTILSGMGAAAGPRRFRQCRSRQIGNQRSHVRCLPQRARRHR